MVFCLISQVACVSTQANSASDEIVKLRHLVENLEKKVSKGLSNQPSVESVKEPGEDNKASKPTPYLIKFVNQFSTSLFKFVKDIESQVIKYATSLRNPEVRESVLKAIGTILGVVFSGLVGEGLFYLMMRPFESRLTRRVEEGHLTKREIFWIRGCLSVLPILIFVSFSALALIYFAPTPLTREIILLLMLAAALYKVGARTSNVLFNPKNPPLRVLSLANSVAKQADQQFRYLFLVVLGIGALIDSMLVLETNAAMMTFVVKFCLFFLYIASVRFVLRSRHYALNWVEKHVARFGKAEHWSEVLIRHFWHRWHIIASGYLTLLAVAFLLSPLSEYRTLLWDFIEMTTIMTGMYLLIFFIPNWMDKVSSALIHSIPGLKSRKKFYSDFLSTVAIMLSLAVMLLFIGAIWDINFLQGLLDGEKTSLYIVTALSILLIIFLGVLFWETIEYLMIGVFEPFLKKRSNAEDKQRIATLVPIIRIILKTLTVVVVTMMIFSELDFNITPIIAVFASLGIAVGLGGQKLAQDLITGTFILAENTLSIGDIVEINGHIGKVEKTTLRTVNLRDARGYFHSIPYSAITVITNTSKEYSRCLFDILIAYEYDYDDMCQILREADAEVRKDPNFGVFIDGELLFDGIQKLDSQGYLIRASILVAPGKQLALQREYNRVIKKYFDKHSIQHPYDRQNIVISNLADIGPILEGESYLKTPTPSS
tara:strand:+ start:179 stop:2317 length:2139 start_codon:yes stop_codon:yes gene_type:complete